MGDRIRRARVLCPACGTASAVRDGVGYFRPGDAPTGAWGGQLTSARTDRSGAPGTWAVPAVRPEIQRALGPSEGTRLELVFPRAPRVPPDPADADRTILVHPEDAEIDPSGVADGGPDRIIVEVHSLPFGNRRLGGVFLGPGFQWAPGVHVLLRELRRVASGPLAALVVLAPDEPRAAAGSVDEQREVVEEFRRARWSAEVVPLAGPGPRTTSGDDPGGSYRLALVVAP